MLFLVLDEAVDLEQIPLVLLPIQSAAMCFFVSLISMPLCRLTNDKAVEPVTVLVSLSTALSLSCCIKCSYTALTQ